ncbi:MAG TPA: glycosyltransferase family 4 protein [Phycisphaerae bacterium]|nr:glycosyltransferase family 4 protein [Phycisphaerae bacterium]
MKENAPQGKLLLVFSQTFAPDPAAVGQHMTDAAIAMASRGHRVRVYASSRSYEDASKKYARRENMQGVDVRRLVLTSFGKKNLIVRSFATASFLIQCFFIGLFTRRVGGIFFSTSPPMIGFTASWLHLLRRVPIAYWAMDLNPDQLIVMGKIKQGGFLHRLLESVNRFILKNTAAVFVLDRFMAQRLKSRGEFKTKMYEDPPWPHEHVLEPVDPAANPFRREHGLENKFVFMYSGNHSPANPLDTILQAAEKFRDDPRIRFVFVGGGLGKSHLNAYIRDHQLSNVLSLPYQPLEMIRYSLPAADVHMVSLGQNMVGIIHPCKIYGAMAAGRPIFFLGPTPSHISDLLEQNPVGWRIAHGDVPGAVVMIRSIVDMPPAQLAQMGRDAQRLLSENFSQKALCTRFCQHLEEALGLQQN